jgi:hypothetical protein
MTLMPFLWTHTITRARARVRSQFRSYQKIIQIFSDQARGMCAEPEDSASGGGHGDAPITNAILFLFHFLPKISVWWALVHGYHVHPLFLTRHRLITRPLRIRRFTAPIFTCRNLSLQI